MRRYNEKLKIKIEEPFRKDIHGLLLELFEMSHVAKCESDVSWMSVMVDVEKKLNKNIEQQRKKKHLITFKYHEAHAFKLFIQWVNINYKELLNDLLKVQFNELLGMIDKQLK